MYVVQAPRVAHPLDLIGAETQPEQLAARDNTVLIAGKRRQLALAASRSGKYALIAYFPDLDLHDQDPGAHVVTADAWFATRLRRNRAGNAATRALPRRRSQAHNEKRARRPSSCRTPLPDPGSS
jgi:hypothetical protein